MPESDFNKGKRSSKRPPTRKRPKPRANADKTDETRATPQPLAMVNGADGIFAEQASKVRPWLEETAKLLERGRGRKAQIAAFGLWIGYPFLLELIGRNVKALGQMPARVNLGMSDVSRAAYHALNAAHHAATNLLMAEAEKCGLDPHALYECGNVIQELYARDPWRHYGGPYDFWPECMGAARYELPAGQQHAIRAGEATFVRLAVKLSIAKTEDTAAVAEAVKEADVLPDATGTGVAVQARYHGKHGELMQEAKKSRAATITRIAELLQTDRRTLLRWRVTKAVADAYPEFAKPVDDKKRATGAEFDLKRVANALRAARFID